MDGARHAEKVVTHYSNISLPQFLEETVEILTLSGSSDVKPDIYIHFISYFISLFGGARGLFFALVSLIYGYFFFSSAYRLSLKIETFEPIIISFFTLFILWKGLEGINTVRTWTGLWVYFYFLYRYAETQDKKYILFSLCSVLIHFAYLMYVVPIFLGLFTRFNLKLALAILILSLVVKIFALPVDFGLLGNNSIGLVESKVEVYAHDTEDKSIRYNENQRESVERANVYKGYYKTTTSLFTQLSLFLLLVIGIVKNKVVLENEHITFFKVAIFIGTILWSIGNFLFIVPAIFNRGITIAGIFNLAILLIYWPKIKNLNILKIIKVKSFYTIALIPTMILVFMYKASSLLGFFNMGLFSPLFVIPWTSEAGSVRDFIKDLLV